MQLTNKAKIAIGLAVLLIIAGVWLYFASKTKLPEDSVTDSPISGDPYAPDTTKYAESPATGQSLEDGLPLELLESPLPQPTASTSASAISDASPIATSSARSARTPVSKIDANGIRSYKVTITPAPNAGPLDWTVTNKELTIIDTQSSPYADKSICELAGLSGSWSNTFEKMSCDAVNFLTSKILEPLQQLACSFHGNALQTNYDSNIKYEYKGGACLIIDRK